jgi:purine-cytosine permease-like protein
MTLAAASYSYLVGAALIGVGSTRLGMIGYLIGLVLGLSFVSLAGGALSYRFGVDTVDAGKASLGMRGAVALLVGVLLCTLGWANVLLAMTARAAVRVLYAGPGARAASAETQVVCVGLAILVAIWVLVRRGPGWMERVANICAVAQLVIAAILFAAILYRYGVFHAWMTNIPPARAYSSNHTMQLTYAVEFGICNALGLLPYMGGLTRLVRRARHLVGPTILGYAVCGAFFPAVIGALAAAATGEADPAVWITRVAGTPAGTVLLAIMLLANLGALVTQIYLAGVAIQQMRVFARLPWPLVVALVLIPSVVVAFNTQWVLNHVMNWLAYNGVMFVGLGSVLFVDFFVLRRGRVEPVQLFAAQRGQLYWFWGGVNWVAVGVVTGATGLYLWLFDPTSLRVGSLFHYAGAAVPTVICSCAMYYLLMKWLVVSRGYGGYRTYENIDEPVAVGL